MGNSKIRLHTLLAAEFQRAIDVSFLILVMLVIFCLGFDSWGNLSQDLFHKPMNLGETVNSVHYYYFNAVSFGGVYCNYIIPLLTAVPYASSYCEELKCGMTLFVISRAKNKKTYCLSKIVTCAVMGGFVNALGSFLFIVLLSFRIPLVTKAALFEARGLPYYHWLAAGYGKGYFVIAVYLAFLTGMLWAVVALTVSAYLPNKYVAITSPFIIRFIVIRTCDMLHVPDAFRLNCLLSGRVVLGSDEITLMISAFAVIIIIIFCGFLFTRRVTRRLQNEVYT